MKNYWTGIFGQVVANLKRFTRDKMSLFFTFLFPLIFLFVFGGIFSNQTVSFRVAIINHADNDFARQFIKQAKETKDSPLKVEEVKNIDEAKEKMKRSALDGIIELPKEFGEILNSRPSGTLNVIYSKGSAQSGQTLTAIMSQITDGINQQIGRQEAPLKVATKEVGDEALTQFDYMFTGLLAFSLMSMGIFGLANILPSEKKQGSLRRLRAAPFTAGQLIIATSIQFIIISLLSVLIMIMAGLLVFNFNMRGDWFVFGLFAVLASAMTVGFGLLIGGWAKNDNQSSVLANLISFPMMFLSGVFFPAFLFPGWLQTISSFIPLAPVVDGFRLIMTEHATLIEILPQIGMVSAWIAIVYILAIKLFKWE